jgi:hypothetical protein
MFQKMDLRAEVLKLIKLVLSVLVRKFLKLVEMGEHCILLIADPQFGRLHLMAAVKGVAVTVVRRKLEAMRVADFIANGKRVARKSKPISTE